MSRVTKIILGAVVAVAALAVGGTWLYINVIQDDAPNALTLDDPSGQGPTTTIQGSSPGSTSKSTDGDWTVAADSVVGYRAKEVLFGQKTEAVGRTTEVTGQMTITGSSVESASFEVDMGSITSNDARRDNQFNGRIMETKKFPKATFELTAPIEFGTVPADGVETKAKAKGRLTIKGQTKDVDLDITAKRQGPTISVLTNYKVAFADWNIDDPSFGPAQVEDNALLEIKLVFKKA